MIFLEGMTSSSGKLHSLPLLPETLSPPSRTLKELFDPTRHPSRALDSPCALIPELQRYKDTQKLGEAWHLGRPLFNVDDPDLSKNDMHLVEVRRRGGGDKEL